VAALNILDWVIIALFIGGFILGYKRGFISQLVSIAGLFAAYIAAYVFYDELAPLISGGLPLETWESYDKYQMIFENMNLDVYLYNAAAFALIFFGVKIGLSLFAHLLNLIVKVPGLNIINKWSGTALAVTEVALLVIVAVHLMSILPSDRIQVLLDTSTLTQYLFVHIPEAAGRLHELWG
jgi:uncharacterized membrane protein required for colicin V production